MPMDARQVSAWRDAKKDRLLPIVYVRGFAMTQGEIDDTTADPFNGFNLGSVLVRTGWTGESSRHIFESPVLRLAQPPFNYRVTFSEGIRGLGAENRKVLKDWQEQPAEIAAASGSPPGAVIAIYRYYDDDSGLFGGSGNGSMEAYGWGLGRLITDLLEVTGEKSVYLVAHSMGGLVARTFLQNEKVLATDHAGNPVAAVQALNEKFPATTLTQAQWKGARAAVQRFFTFGTPHNGITGQGGLGNGITGMVGYLLGNQVDNFDRDRMQQYLGLEKLPSGKFPPANSLDGKFPVDRVFCLVGTGSADYPVAGGLSRRLIGQRSDGLVEIDNAVACAPENPNERDKTVLAARAYVRRAHSGPYGMVNSEEGFGNLARFLFGDLRVDGRLEVETIDLPPAVQAELDAGKAIRASYTFESFLRIRGERWAITERLARDGTASFRRFDELFPDKQPGFKPSAEDLRLKELHRQIDLFTAFLDPARVPDPQRRETLVDGSEAVGGMGFAFRLRIAVPEYTVDGLLWSKDLYEGSALLDRDLAFLAYKDAAGWQLAWGDNVVGNGHLAKVPLATAPDDDTAKKDGTPFRRDFADRRLEFVLPLSEYRPNKKDGDPPIVRVWLRLVAREVPDLGA